MTACEAAALALLGTPFRPHGRSARWGVDCVGLVALSLRSAGWAGTAPDAYRLRFGDAEVAARALDEALARRAGDARPGDVLLLKSGPGQLHLAIGTRDGLVHADAGAGRVVLRPGPPPWPVLGAWFHEEDEAWRRCC